MAHAKPEHLKELAILLSEIRKAPMLKEKSLGCFYLKGKGVLHFHIKGERFYAHVFDGRDWSEVDIKLPLTAVKQKDLSKSILQVLAIRE
jgi:hypothetical protein